MNLRRLAARVATAGAVGALGAGALAGVAAAPASADASAVEYTCSALGSNFPVLVQPTGSIPQLKAGQPVAAGINMPVKFILSRAVLDGMAGKGINSVGISSDSLGLSVGTTPVGLTGLSVPMTAVPATGDLVLNAPGKTAGFTAPAAGTYDLTLPAAFTASVSTNLIPLNASCAIANPAAAKIGSVDVADPAGPQGLQYTCAINGSSLPVYVEATTVPDFGSVVAGSPVAAGARQVKVNYTIPAASAALLAPATKAMFGSDDFAFRLGSVGTIPASGLTSAQGAIAAGEHLVLGAEGTTKAFTAPAAGTYDVKLPSSFTGSLTTDTAPAATGPCTIVSDSSSTVGSMTVTPAPKQASTTTATAPKSIANKAKLKISVTVTANAPATGKVTAKEGAKTLGSATLAGGKATITVKGLKPGKHTITVVYAGDSTTNGSTSKAVTVKVKK